MSVNATSITKEMLTADVVSRFQRQLNPAPSGCTEWAGGKDAIGYGRIKVAGKMLLAHRVSVAIANGGLSTGTVVDHTCRNPSCVNPAHLDVVSQRENIARGTSPLGLVIRAIEESGTCVNGHPEFEGSRRKMGGKIRCIQCEADRIRARDATPEHRQKLRDRMARLRARRKAESQ